MKMKLQALVAALLALVFEPIARYAERNLLCYAYSGTTAGSTLANPPILMFGGMGGRILNNGSTINGAGGGSGCQLWLYASTNSSTEPFAANFFTDAKVLGMRGGDVVIQVGATGSTQGVSISVLGTVSTAGAAYASSGAQISSTFA